MVSRLSSFPKRHPFVFGVTVATAKTGGVDLLVQKYVEKKEQIDWTRASVGCRGVVAEECALARPGLIQSDRA